MKKLFLISLVGLAICLFAMPAMADTQILLNGGFENWSVMGVNGPPDNWGYRTAYPTVTADSTTVRTGNYSARYFWNTTTTTKLYSDTMAVTPGAVYTCTLWVNDADTSGRARPWFWFIPNGLSPSPAIPYSSNVAGWEALVWTAVCPAGSYTLNMEIRGNSEGAARWDGDAVVYFDDFVLWEAVSTTNAPPVISSVLRYPYPLVPGGATVTSKATITDDHTIVQDSLYRRILPGTFAPVYHDSIATGGNYWYTLGSYTIGDSVEYYVIAVDDSSARTASNTYGFTCVDTNVPVTPIAQVQFNNTNPGGTAPDTCYPSPLLGNLVKLNGLVTAVYQQSGRHGWFWLQDADSAWSGVYVYGGTTGDTVQIGDSITVTVSVAEYYGLTEMMSPTGMVKHATGRPLPAPLQITSADLSSTGCSPTREKYEGVFMELHNFTITSYQGSPLYAYWGNDGSGDSCAIWTTIPNNGYDIPTYTIGQQYSSIKGVGYYTRGQYVLGPRVSADLVPANTPPSITGVTVYPSPMVPGQQVTLKATITTTGTIVSDSLYYALNAGAFVPVIHDSIVGTNYWFKMASSYVIGDSVSYYVVATDNIAQRTQTSTSFFVVPDTSFCGADTIYNVEYTLNQGSDTSCFISPYEGQIVNICGIVTAVQQGATKYFYLQDPRTSAGYAGWTGITVYDYVDALGNTFNGAVGDKVELNGRVKEYYGWTEIDSLIDFTIRSTSNPLPETTDVRIVDLVGGCNFGAEPYENVLVKIDSVTVLSAKDANSFWIKDNSTTDSIYMQNYMWVNGTGPAIPPSTGARYLTLVGVIKFEGRYVSPNVRSYVLMPRIGSDYVPLVVPQANLSYAFPTDQTHLAVQFDRAMQQASAETPSHYTTTSGLSITAAALDTTRRRVILTTGTQTNGFGDTLIVVGVTDSLGVTMINPDSTRIWQGFTPIAQAGIPKSPTNDTCAMVGEVITIKGVIVADSTAYYPNNLYINDNSDTIYNGIELFLPNNQPWLGGYWPVRGDTVIVAGYPGEYFHETQFNVTTHRYMQLVSAGAAPQPSFKTADVTEFLYKSDTLAFNDNEEYEGVLVKLCDSLIAQAPATPDAYTQLLISMTTGDTISIDGQSSHCNYPALTAGTRVDGITGVVRFRRSHRRLVPRDTLDFNTGFDCGGGPSECEYLIGDISGDNQRLGGDVTYGVRYFKGIGTRPPDSCFMDSTGTYLYVSGDCNGNCEFRGSDITRLVAYFKGNAQLSCCHWFPTTLPPILRPIDQGVVRDKSALGD